MELTQQVVRIGFEMVKLERGVDGYRGNCAKGGKLIAERIVGCNPKRHTTLTINRQKTK